MIDFWEEALLRFHRFFLLFERNSIRHPKAEYALLIGRETDLAIGRHAVNGGVQCKAV